AVFIFTFCRCFVSFKGFVLRINFLHLSLLSIGTGCHFTLAAYVGAWRCGGILCYVSPDMLLIKDMKMKIYSKAGLYSSVGYVAQHCYIDQDMFVKPP
ncbi:MAG: hypothetical protein KA399_05995, partial [Chitinophagaceae bacterium]|nr:hypothetical protein [Chitinophagaceae bacterium]